MFRTKNTGRIISFFPILILKVEEFITCFPESNIQLFDELFLEVLEDFEAGTPPTMCLLPTPPIYIVVKFCVLVSSFILFLHIPFIIILMLFYSSFCLLK